MTYKVVVSKHFNQAAIQVRVENSELSVSVELDDFLVNLAGIAAPMLAADAVRHAGNPSILMTNTQLASRVSKSISVSDVLASIQSAAKQSVSAMKQAAVVAE